MGTDEYSVLLKTRPFIYRCLNVAPNFEKPGFKIIYHLPPFDIWVPALRKGRKGNEEIKEDLSEHSGIFLCS